MSVTAAPTHRTFDLDRALISLVASKYPKSGQLARRRRIAELRRKYMDGDPKTRDAVNTYAKVGIVNGTVTPVSSFTPPPPARPDAEEVTQAIKALTLLQLPDGSPEERVHRAAEMMGNYGHTDEVTRLVDDFIYNGDDADTEWPF
jgi:hypothetical protein